MGNNKKNQIIYGIGFDVDQTGLRNLESQLKKIASLTQEDLINFNTNGSQSELHKLQNSLIEIQGVTAQVGQALSKSFNVKLDSINVANFDKELKLMNLDIDKIAKSWAPLGQKGQEAFSLLTQKIVTARHETKQTWNLSKKLGESLKNIVTWNVSSAVLNTFTGTLQQAWGYAKHLDRSLNDIRIVTNKSAADMEKFAKSANKAAQALGSSTTAYTEASLIYYQQGLNDKDVEARTNVTMKAANVTGQSAAEVSEQLTAIWNGYKVAAEEAEFYTDKLAAVAATTAADLEELSTGMSKTASAANAMGVDIDQLSAQLATIISVTRQDANVVGTALKTIYSRIGDLKVDGVDEFGVSLGDVSGQLRQMGVDVLDQQGNLRDIGKIIEEVAAKWGTWTDAQQQAAAVAIAGKRQYNNLFALFENWDMYESSLVTSKNSAGTLQKQQEIFMESLKYKLQEITTATEGLYDSLFDSESAKQLLTVFRDLISTVGDFIDAIGGGGNLLLMFGGALSKILSPQLAQGAASVVSHFEVLKKNKEQDLAESRLLYEIEHNHYQLTIDDIQDVVDAEKKRLEAQSVLSEEENKALREKIDLHLKEINLLKEKKRLAEESLEKQQGKVQSAVDQAIAESTIVDETDNVKLKVKNPKKHWGAATIAGLTNDISFKTRLVADDKEKRQYNLEKLLGEDGGQELQQQIEAERRKIDEEEAYRRSKIEQKYAERIQRAGSAPLRRKDKVWNGLDAEGRQISANVSQTESKINELETQRTNIITSGAEDPIALQKADAQIEKLKAELETQKQLFAKNEKAKQDYTQNKVDQATEEKNAELQRLIEEYNNLRTRYQQALEDAVAASIKTHTEFIEDSKKSAAAFGEAAEILDTSFNETNIAQILESNLLKDEFVNKDARTGSVNVAGTLNKTASTQSDKAAQRGVAQLEQSRKKANEANQKAAAVIEQLSKGQIQNTKLTNAQQQAVDDIAERYGGWTSIIDLLNQKTGTLGKSQEKVIAITKEFSKALKSNETTITKNAEAIESNIQAVEDLKEKEKQEAEEQEEIIAKSSKSLNQWFEDNKTYLQQGVSGLITLSGGLTSIIGGVNGLANSFKVLENDDLTPWERANSILLGIGGSVITLVSAVPTIIKGIKSIGAVLTEVGVSSSVAFGWIAVASAALIVIVSIVSNLNKQQETAMDKAKKATEQAAAAAEKAQNRVLELKDAYNDLLTEVQDYKSARLAIDEMRVGTEEWQQAVQNLNFQVMDLINKYPQLANSLKIDANGIYSIDQEVITKAIKQQQEELASAQNTAYLKNIELAQSKKYQASLEIAEEGALSNIANEEYNSKDRTIIKASDIEKVAQLFGKEAIAEVHDYSEWAREEGFTYLEENGIQTDESARMGLVDLSAMRSMSQSQIDALVEKVNAGEYGKEIQEAVNHAAKVLGENTLKQSEQNALIDANTKALIANLSQRNGISSDLAEDLISDSSVSTNIDDYKTKAALDTDNWIQESVVNHGAWGGGSFFNVGENIDTNDQAEVAANQMNKALAEAFEGLDVQYEPVTAAATRKIGKTRELGSLEIEVDGQAMTFEEAVNYAAQLRMEKALNAAQESATELKKQGYNENAARFTEGRNLGGSWESATIADYNTLSSYDLGEDYSKAVEEGREDFIKKIMRQRYVNAGSSLTKADIEGRYSQFTEADFLAFNQSQAVMKAAGIGPTAIANIVNSVGIDPAKNKQFQEALEKVTNWSDITQVNTFRKELLDMGVDINNLGEEWDGYITNITSGWKQWIRNSQQVINNLKTINELTKDLETGEVLSQGDYNSLLDIDPSIGSKFIRTAEGYKFLGESGELEKALKAPYQDLSTVQKSFAQIRQSADKVSGDSLFNASEFENKNAQEIKAYFTEDRKELAGLLGHSSDTINSYLRSLDKDTTSAEYIYAASQLASIAQQINQAALDNANGLYDAEQAEQIWATSVATGWREVKGSGISNESKKKAYTAYGNEYLSQLGFAGWDLSEEMTEDFLERLEGYVENAHKLDLDYLADAQKKIDKLEAATDRLWGKDRLSNIEDLINAQDEYIERAEQAVKDAENKAKDQESLVQNVYGNEFNKKFLNNNGEVDTNKINDEIVRLRTLGDATSLAQADTLQNWVDAIDLANKKSLEAIDAANKKIDLRIQQFEEGIQLRLDLEQAVRDWKEFVQENLSGGGEGLDFFMEKGIAQAVDDLLDLTTNDLASLQNSLKDLEGFLNEDSKVFELFGDNQSKIMENWERNLSTAKEKYEQLKDTVTQLYETYFEAQDKLIELYDEQIEKLSSINTLYRASANLTKLVGGSAADYYQNIVSNLDRAYELALSEQQTALEEYNKTLADGNKDMIATTEENLTNATEAVATALQDKLAAIAELYSEKLSDIVNATISEATGGMNLEAISELWQLETKAADRTLDEVETIYSRDELNKKIQKSIEETDNIAAQNKLNEMRIKQNEKLNKIMEERGKLSQYDLDRANAEYELTLKQIALEEAQQTANKMKLTRDALGNYTYQYVADQDSISDAEQELAAAEKALYDLDKERNQSLVDEYYSTMTEANTAIAEAMANGDQERVDRLKEYYFGQEGLLSGIQTELGYASTNLKSIGSQLIKGEFASGITKFTDQITNMKLDEMLENIEDLINGKEGGWAAEFGSITENIGKLLGDENKQGIITSTAKLIDMSVQNTTDLEKQVIKIQSKTAEMIGQLQIFAPALTEYANQLKNNAQAYLNYSSAAAGIGEKELTTALDNNRGAVQENTKALITYLDYLNDSKINGNVSVTGWEYNDKQGWYEINANDIDI